MKIRLTKPVIGAWKGKPGDEVDRPDKEAGQLVAGGFAVLVNAPVKLETATLKTELETADKV